VVKGQKGLNLAEQMLVDCSTAGSCNGGNPGGAISWVAGNGLTTTSAYPYTAKDGSCKTKTGSYKVNSATKVAASASSLQSAIN